ncbi:MAG: adenylyltransferase/cytidyltransferase family protein [Planctomycetes bacterium]|nr:adenylyltransferase/cytidyltransferase family protein [Planctomycetota bacterium]
MRLERRLYSRSELAAEFARLRSKPRPPRIVLANGCFDLLHVGHLRYLEDARSRGDLLVVALNTDASVRMLKGAGRPLVPLMERAELLLGLSVVGAVTSFDEPTLEATLRELRPDVHAKGTDYSKESVPEAAIDRELGIEIAICGDSKAHASSEIIARLAREPRA